MPRKYSRALLPSFPQRQERNDSSCLIILFLISEFPVLITFLSFFTRIIKNVSYYKVYHIGYTSKDRRLKKLHFKDDLA